MWPSECGGIEVIDEEVRRWGDREIGDNVIRETKTVKVNG